ncbi:hypothetical protein GCM10007108_01290 [Thermogymnomonas acidicola]|uniref:TrmB family transcriptional regulator n=1 Tax=Thermogymnomonas acidicola TaxID=399579 RepID=A0AA37BPI2_9ARCH|nr:TrmB family transcriptional regulator [Thermogymnomonas acidicola]GGM66841.1 hypothetical protein GCM10007108_01290 [Thermogymnomonas acidicola]
MPLDPEQVSRIQENLKMLGLSAYEAQGFIALVYHGVANADTVADTAQIPRTSAYKVMESLVKKGFVRETEGRPKMFKPEDLNKLEDEISSKVRSLFEDLRQVRALQPSKGQPQLVYTIYGRQNVMMKIGEMINLTESEIFICTPKVKEIRTEMRKEIENAIKRGVKLIFVTPPNKRVPPNITVYRKEGLIATDIVSDKTRALLAGADLDACGYTDNPALALHVYQFITMMMRDGVS